MANDGMTEIIVINPLKTEGHNRGSPIKLNIVCVIYGK